MIPPGARPRLSAGRDLSAVRFVVARRVVLLAWLDDAGFPIRAMACDRDGLPHGLEREWHANGRVRYEARYVHGLQHGLQRQWDEHGRILVRTRFVRGTGLDLYCGDVRPARISESRELVAGERHGFERWWTDGRLWMEHHFQRGREHGIARSWSIEGRLKRGYPRYFVQGERVDRRTYLRRCADDTTLPVPQAADDRPFRPRPVGVR